MPSGSTPFWKPSDLEISKLKEGQSAYQYIVTAEEKPPYCKGPMPLEYKVGYPPWGLPGYAFQSEIPLYFKFSEFTVYFVYDGPILIGAGATDSDGNVVAEARLRYSPSEDRTQGIEAEEVHYDTGGRAIFHCTSTIDSSSGHKVNENHSEGKKRRDYFFIWPHQ
ncbi:MAG: hypothetical protein NTX17_05830 [Candidatus Eisenbacteria bacterium]|nr:hypothetical protein [Candidatus Eisenbacteria bacterium]